MKFVRNFQGLNEHQWLHGVGRGCGTRCKQLVAVKVGIPSFIPIIDEGTQDQSTEFCHELRP